MSTLRIDPSSATPIWSQIEDGLRRLVASGALKPGAAVPSVRDLASDLRINPATVAKAYQRLTDAGVLTVRRGDGTYVADAPPAMSKAERARILREAAGRFARSRVDARCRAGRGRRRSARRLEERGQLVTEPLRVEGLTVRYGRAIACRDVSFAVAPGSVYALLGRNGAGKSSLVRCLLGQQKATSGRDAALRRRLLDDAPGGHGADGRGARGAGRAARDDGPGARRTSAAASTRAGTRRPSPRASSASALPPATPFGRLSRGQKTQVQLALALGHAPELLVLDDPTLGLDAVARRALYDEIVGELADRGTTVFLTTHDLAGFEGIATRVGILKDGQARSSTRRWRR